MYWSPKPILVAYWLFCIIPTVYSSFAIMVSYDNLDLAIVYWPHWAELLHCWHCPSREWPLGGFRKVLLHILICELLIIGINGFTHAFIMMWNQSNSGPRKLSSSEDILVLLNNNHSALSCSNHCSMKTWTFQPFLHDWCNEDWYVLSCLGWCI